MTGHSGNSDPIRAELAHAPLDALLGEVAGRVRELRTEQGRWELLLDAVVTMATDLSLDEMLERIVEIGADLAGARYAALGVLGSGEDRSMDKFVTRGIDEEQAGRMGPFPEDPGLLALLVDHPEPLRLDDLSSHPAFGGFPPEHPTMTTFLGVPVRIREKVFGNLYFCDKLDGAAFTEQDERIVTALAAAAGVAIENARLLEEGALREQWLAAAADITTRLLRQESEEDALQILADRVRELAGADAGWVVAGPDDEHLELRVVTGLPATREQMAAVSFEHSLARSVVRSGVPMRVESLVDDPRARNVATELGWPELGVTIVLPLQDAATIHGVVALTWLAGSDRRGPVDPVLPARFAQQAALAIHMARAQAAEQRLAIFEDRDRIARDLHDLVIQRLFAIGLSLQGVTRQPARDEVNRRIEQAVDDLDLTIRDIRRTIYSLGSMGTDTDLQAAVTDVVTRAEDTLGFRPHLRLEGPVRARVSEGLAPDLLAALTEALSNAARHAGARSVSVEISALDGLRLRVTDDGRGIGADVAESGLSNLRRRAEQHGGTLTISSVPGRGTTLDWWVPLA